MEERIRPNIFITIGLIYLTDLKKIMGENNERRHRGNKRRFQ